MTLDGKVRLDEIADLDVGFAFTSGNFTANSSDRRLLRGDNIGQGVTRWDRAAYWPRAESAQNRYELREGDVVLAMDRPWIEAGLKYATVSASDLPALLVQRVARLRAKPGNDQGYLGCVIGSNEFTEHVLAVQTGTAIPHISGGQIAGYRLRPHSLADQQAIAEVLEAFDEKLAANTKLVTLLAELVDASFTSIVGSWHGQVPFGDLVSVTKGVSYRSTDLVPSSTALVTLKSIQRDGSYSPRGLKAFAGAFKLGQKIRTGELVVAQTDLTQAADVVGRAVRVPATSDYDTLVASLDIAIVRPTPGVEGAFVLGVMRDRRFTEHCRSRTSGTTVLHLAGDAIQSFSAPQVSSELQKRYAAVVGPMHHMSDAVERESEALATMRDALLPQLMSGKIRVKDLEQMVGDVV